LLQKKSILKLSDLFRPSSFDHFFQDEHLVWVFLKGTAYYQALKAAWSGIEPLPLSHWIRLNLQLPQSTDMVELARIFHEEDTITALCTVLIPSLPEFRREITNFH
jgi:hypothetical protein